MAQSFDRHNSVGENSSILPAMSTRPLHYLQREHLLDVRSAGNSHITPRNSDADQAIATSTITPYGTLRQLANMPRPVTPLRRASSAGPPRRTPGAAQRFGGSGRKTNVLTPHGRAAMRELEARRAGLTPGKDRRRSGRQQRETPRNDLRALSRLLAPQSHPVVQTPLGHNPITRTFALTGEDELDDDGSNPEMPRLSLPLGQDDEEDDSLLLPPRSAGLEDQNFTVQSIELPRRALSEQPPRRLSRGSFGSIRLSDQFADLDEIALNSQGDAFDSSLAIGGHFNDHGVPDMYDEIQGAHVSRDTGYERGHVSLLSGRDSDIRPASLPTDDTENTFMFTVPSREVLDSPLFNHAEESRSRDGSENHDWDQVVGVAPAELDAYGMPNDEEVDISLHNTIVQDINTSVNKTYQMARKKKTKVSKHGIQYPSLPVGVVKKLATTYARMSGNSRAKISKDSLDVIIQASDWFFEQASDDLGAYAKHAGRKTIEESDVVTLMKRQRQTNSTTTPFSLAQKNLPRELLQELRMVTPAKIKRGRLQFDEVGEDSKGHK